MVRQNISKINKKAYFWLIFLFAFYFQANIFTSDDQALSEQTAEQTADTDTTEAVEQTQSQETPQEQPEERTSEISDEPIQKETQKASEPAESQLVELTPEEYPEVEVDLKEKFEIKTQPFEAPAGVVLGNLTINIPLIGEIVLMPEKDPKTDEDLLKAKFADESKKLDVGGIKIDQGEIVVRKGDKVSATARAFIFGKEGTLKLKSITRAKNLESADETTSRWAIGRAHFVLTFKEKPTLSILPDKDIVLSKLNLILEKSKPAYLYANIRFLGQPIKLTFNIAKDIIGVGFSISKPMKLGSLIKPLSTTKFNNILFKKLSLKTEFLTALATSEQTPTTTFSGETDFTPLFPEKTTETPTGPPSEDIESAESIAEEKSEATQAGEILKEEEIITEEGPIDPRSQKAFDYIKSLIPGQKYAQKNESFDDANSVDTKTDIGQAQEEAEPSAKNSEPTTDIDAPLNTLTFSGSVNKKDGFHFEALMTTLDIPVLGAVKNAKFIFDYSYKKGAVAKLRLSGDGSVTIPNIGTLDYTLAAGYSKKGLSLEAIIHKEITFQGVTIKNGRILVKPKRKILVISGDTSFKGFDLVASLEIKPDPEDKSKRIFDLSGQVNKEKIQPFENTGIPLIKNITLTDIDASLKFSKGEKSTAQFILRGKTNILNVETPATVVFIKQEGQEGALLKAALPANWKLSDSIPGAHFADGLVFEDASFIVSSIDNYEDPETSQTIKKGLSLNATSPLTGTLAPVKTLLGGKLDKVNVYGVLATNPMDIVLGAKLTEDEGGLAVKSDKVAAGPMSLEISGKPSLAILCTLYVKPSEKDSRLTFVGRIELGATEADFAATMLGTWNNPLGINGLKISNVALQLGINYAIFASTGLPSKLGLGGELEIGDKKLSLYGQFDATLKDMALQGKLNELTIEDIIKGLAYPIGVKIPTGAIPNIGIKDVEVKVAAHNVKIGEITIEQGLTLKGEIDILTKKAVLDFNVSPSGIHALGYTSPIEIGPLHITASKPKDSPTGGPIVSLDLNASKQEFLVSGKLELVDIFKVDNYLKIGSSGITFNFETDIANGMFNALINGTSSGPITNPDFILVIDMKQKFIDYILSQVDKGIDAAEKDLKEKLNTAQNNVRKIDDAIAKSDHDIDAATKSVKDAENALKVFDEKIKEANNAIDSATAKVNNAKEKLNVIDEKIKESNEKLNIALQKLREAHEKVNSINNAIKEVSDKIAGPQEKVNSILNEIHAKNAWYDSLSTEMKVLRAIDYGVEVGALYAAYGVATGALQAAKGVGEGTLIAARATANVGVTIAETFVNLAKQTAQGTLVSSKAIAKGALTVAEQTLDKVVKSVSVGTLIASRETAKASLKISQEFLDKVVKNISRETLIAAREASIGFLEGVKQTGLVVLEGGKYVVKGVLGAVNLTHVRFDGSVHEIEAGKLPNLMFEFNFFGKIHTLKLTFDLKNPVESTVGVVTSFTDFIFKSSDGTPIAKIPAPKPVIIDIPKIEVPKITIPNLVDNVIDLGWIVAPAIKLKDVSASSYGMEDEVWGIGMNNEIYRMDSKTWKQVTGSATQISVGNKDNVWVVNSSNDLFKFEKGNWVQKGGAVNYVTAGTDGSVWLIMKNGDILQLEGNSFVKDYTGAPKFKQMSVANKSNMWGVTENNEVYKFEINKWTQVNGKLSQVSVAPDGTVMGLTTEDDPNGKKIVQRFGLNWIKVSGGLIKLSVANGSIVWGINSSHDVFTTDKYYATVSKPAETVPTPSAQQAAPAVVPPAQPAYAPPPSATDLQKLRESAFTGSGSKKPTKPIIGLGF